MHAVAKFQDLILVNMMFTSLCSCFPAKPMFPLQFCSKIRKAFPKVNHPQKCCSGSPIALEVFEERHWGKIMCPTTFVVGHMKLSYQELATSNIPAPRQDIRSPHIYAGVTLLLEIDGLVKILKTTLEISIHSESRCWATDCTYTTEDQTLLSIGAPYAPSINASSHPLLHPCFSNKRPTERGKKGLTQFLFSPLLGSGIVRGQGAGCTR